MSVRRNLITVLALWFMYYYPMRSGFNGVDAKGRLKVGNRAGYQSQKECWQDMMTDRTMLRSWRTRCENN